MKSNFYQATTITVDKKTLEKLKKLSARSSRGGRSPHKSVSEIVREAIANYLGYLK